MKIKKFNLKATGGNVKNMDILKESINETEEWANVKLQTEGVVYVKDVMSHLNSLIAGES